MACLFQKHAALGVCLGWLQAGSVTGGTVETLDHRTFEGTVGFATDGGLVVQTREGPQPIPLDQVRLARFNAVRLVESVVPGGWQVEDIGLVHGQSISKDDVFDLKVSGGAVRDTKQQMAHFTHRIIRADGEISARLETTSLTGPALAGVLLRENLDPNGGLAFLAVTEDRRLRFESREAGYGPIKRSEFGPVPLPVWLKLGRQSKDNAVTAYRSPDGVNWQKIAQAKLSCPSEPFPAGEDRWRPKLLAGLAVSGTSNDSPATARFDRVVVSAHGLLGEYFADADFRRLRFARPDSRLDYFWGSGSPAPDLDKDHFSVRWTGQVEPKFSENHRFYFEANTAMRLWVNGEEMPKSPWRPRDKKGEPPARELPLTAGQKCDIKIEYKPGQGMPYVRLGWSSRSQSQEVIPSSALSFNFTATTPDEDGDSPATNALPARGVLLRGGSFLAVDVQSADDTVTTVSFAGKRDRDLAILNTKIARVVFRPSRRAPPPELTGGHAGIFLKNGDFYEGDFQSVTGRTLIVSSVLLGRKKFNLDHGSVVALVLHGPTAESSVFEVKLLDGSVLRATRLRWLRDAAVVTDSTLGEVTIPQQEFAELRRTGSDTGASGSPARP